MRSALAITAVILMVASGFGGHYATSTEEPVDAFSARYLTFVDRNPNEVSRYITGSITECLPQEARAYVGDPVVMQQATKTFLKSMTLLAEGKSPEQMSSEFIPWIIKQAEGASSRQKQDFLVLAKNGLNDPDTMACVMFAVRKSIDQGIDVIATEWDLRS